MPLAGMRWNGPVYWFGRTDTLSGASESRAGARRYERGPGSVPTGRPPRVVDADVGVLDRPAGRQDVSGGHGQRPSSDRRCREINAARLDGTQFVRRLPTQAESPRDPELRVDQAPNESPLRLCVSRLLSGVSCETKPAKRRGCACRERPTRSPGVRRMGTISSGRIRGRPRRSASRDENDRPWPSRSWRRLAPRRARPLGQPGCGER
jgi:hypothetical protein